MIYYKKQREIGKIELLREIVYEATYVQNLARDVISKLMDDEDERAEWMPIMYANLYEITGYPPDLQAARESATKWANNYLRWIEIYAVSGDMEDLKKARELARLEPDSAARIFRCDIYPRSRDMADIKEADAIDGDKKWSQRSIAAAAARDRDAAEYAP